MKLNDVDNSTIALYFVYCLHEVKPSQEDGDVVFRMKVYSGGNDVQWFSYDDCVVMRKDMEFISKWIHIKEMHQIVKNREEEYYAENIKE